MQLRNRKCRNLPAGACDIHSLARHDIIGFQDWLVARPFLLQEAVAESRNQAVLRCRIELDVDGPTQGKAEHGLIIDPMRMIGMIVREQ